MMPPPRRRRGPTPATLHGAHQRARDARSTRPRAAKPNPGGRMFQRLNRPEYARAIKDLLDLDVDAGDWLPLDTKSANFDNIADEQTLSPTLLESYLNAAARHQPHGGRRSARRRRSTAPTPTRATCRSIRGTTSRARPTARAAAWSSSHVFPADGEYVFEVDVHRRRQRAARGRRHLDRRRARRAARLRDAARRAAPTAAARCRCRPSRSSSRPASTRSSAAFVRTLRRPVRRPDSAARLVVRRRRIGRRAASRRCRTCATSSIHGPYKTTGVSDTASRQKIFTCRPTSRGRRAAVRAHDRHAASATTAYRRPLTRARSRRADAVLRRAARPRADSRAACARRSKRSSRARTSSSASSSSPTTRQAGRHVSRQRRRPRVAAVVLPLGHAAGPGAARRRRHAASSSHAGRASRSRRAACSPIRAPRRSAPRFAGQWLRLQDVDKVHPDPNFYPNFDEQPRRRDAARDRAVLQQPRARGPQRARPATRRLHVRERAARAALRHPRRRRRPVPQGARIRTRRAAACSARAACWCRPRSPTARRRCCAASG